MANLEDIEKRTHTLELQHDFEKSQQKKEIELNEKEHISFNSKISEINEKIIKLLLINQELVSQGKVHKEIIEQIQKSLEELKNVTIDDNDGKAKMIMSISDFAKYISAKLNPDIQVNKWVLRLKNYGFLSLVLILLILLIFNLKQFTEISKVLEILKTIK